MTFEDFQNTRRESADLGRDVSDCRWDDEVEPGAGFVYLDVLYIERVGDHWPDAARARGKFYLILERDEYISDDLEELERKLYDWAMASGYQRQA